MGKGWNHSMCQKCWTLNFPNREPTKLLYPQEETCCFCGEKTSEGIFIREDPKLVEFCQHED